MSDTPTHSDVIKKLEEIAQILQNATGEKPKLGEPATDPMLTLIETAFLKGMDLHNSLTQNRLPNTLLRRIAEDILEQYGPEKTGVLSWVNPKGVVKLPDFVVKALGVEQGGGVIFYVNEHGVVILSDEQVVAEQLARTEAKPDEDPAP